MAEIGILSQDDRVELLDGDIILMPPIGDWHAGNVNHLIDILHPPLRGRVTLSVQSPTRLSDVSEPQPDLMLLKRRDDYYKGGHPKPDDILLLIEVSDTTLEYDRNQKLSAYARAGIPEVWIVARDDRRIEAYSQPSDGKFTKVIHASPTDTIAPQAFPDVSLQVGQFFPKSKPKPRKDAPA